MLEWNSAKQATLNKWRRLRERVGMIDLSVFLEEASDACPFCEDSAAKKLAAEFAGEHVRLQCTLCEVHNRYGSCHERIDRLMAAAVCENWECAAGVIDEIIAWVETMRPVSELDNRSNAEGSGMAPAAPMEDDHSWRPALD